MATVTIQVPEVHCQHCVDAIQGALGQRDGVQSATVDLATTSVQVDYEPSDIAMEAIVATIEDQGYEVPIA